MQRESIGVSADYIRRAFLFLGIESKTRHKAHRTPRKVRDPYPNLIFSTWETVDRPGQVIVSDMTAFWTRFSHYEMTLYFDVFTKQIVGCGLSCKRGDPRTYYDGLDQALSALEGTGGDPKEEPVVFHTDQGSVYTSMTYNEIIRDRNIVRSCSRAGRPTDNPVNESLNGWIKEELFLDFGLYDATDVPAAIDAYIGFYNSERPSYSLGYDTPDNFHRRFMSGEIMQKDTFRNRVLDETPKFIRNKKEADKQPDEEE
jgi:transposase InsO family protein